MTKLLFTKEEVKQTRNHLMRLLRTVFYKKAVDQDAFVKLNKDMWQRSGRGDERGGLNSHLNRYRKHLIGNGDPVTDEITYKKFFYILNDILRLQIVRFSVTVKDMETGEHITYNSDDQID